MPRQAKGPRLYLKRARRDAEGRLTHAPRWVIRDGSLEVGTGALQHDLATAETALGEYVRSKYDPSTGSDNGEKNPFVLDICSHYIAEKLEPNPKVSDRALREAKARLARITDFFDGRTINSLQAKDFRRYARQRGSSCRRELEDFRAALNFVRAEGMTDRFVPVEMPAKYQARTTWLTRSEVAKLIWTAWRMRQVLQHKTTREPIISKRAIAKHVARFSLVALYTGSRAGVVVGAAIGPTIGRGYVDLDTGMFYRKPRGALETKKRAPDIILHPKLLGHIRRWNAACEREHGRSLRAVIEWQGEPLKKINKAFRAVREAAGFGDDVVPHTLRHTAVTWGLLNGGNRWDIGSYVGLSQDTIERVYGHADTEKAARAAGAIVGRRTAGAEGR